MSHDYWMVDAKGDPILKPDANGEIGCRRCSESMRLTITYNHTPHIQFALRGTLGIEDGYWVWLNGKTGAETLPALQAAYTEFDADRPPTVEERDAYKGMDDDWWKKCYIPKREEAQRSLGKLLRMAEDAPQGRWSCC